MKCDELKQYEVFVSNPYNTGGSFREVAVLPADKVYEVIAELKAENERLNNALDKERSETIKYMDKLCNAKNEIERLTIDKRNAELRADVADATDEKLKVENAELKEKLHDAEMAKDLAEAANTEYRLDIEKLKAENERLKDKRLDVKDAAHILKAFKFYLCQLTHCAYDERTAQWIIDNWEQDYDRVEVYK